MYVQSMKVGNFGVTDQTVSAVRRLSKIMAVTLFTALGAQFAVRLPFTPVPITMQTLFVVLAGITLGPRDGFYAMLSYIALGVSGAPVFAGLSFGPAVLFGPTGGYLLAFPAAAFLSGYFHEAGKGKTAASALGIVSGLIVILVAGTAYLSLITGLSVSEAYALAVVPFIAVEFVKLLAAFLMVIGKWSKR